MICIECKQEYIARRLRQRFCSNACNHRFASREQMRQKYEKERVNKVKVPLTEEQRLQKSLVRKKKMLSYVIDKKGNWGIITPVPQGVLAATLLKYMSYERKGKEFMPNPAWALVKLYSVAKGRFPWGLLSTVKKVMDKYNETRPITYSVIYGKPYSGIKIEESPVLRDYQNEAIKRLHENGGGILSLPTSAGKTITIVEYLRQLNLKSLVIVPTIDIRTQWQKHNLPNVTVSVYHNRELLKDEYVKQFDVICIDEAHRTAAKSIYNVAMKSKTDCMLIGVSATI